MRHHHCAARPKPLSKREKKGGGVSKTPRHLASVCDEAAAAEAGVESEGGERKKGWSMSSQAAGSAPGPGIHTDMSLSASAGGEEEEVWNGQRLR